MSSKKHYLGKALSAIAVLGGGLFSTSSVVAGNCSRCTGPTSCSSGYPNGATACVFFNGYCTMGNIQCS